MDLVTAADVPQNSSSPLKHLCVASKGANSMTPGTRKRFFAARLGVEEVESGVQEEVSTVLTPDIGMNRLLPSDLSVLGAGASLTHPGNFAQASFSSSPELLTVTTMHPMAHLWEPGCSQTVGVQEAMLESAIQEHLPFLVDTGTWMQSQSLIHSSQLNHSLKTTTTGGTIPPANGKLPVPREASLSSSSVNEACLQSSALLNAEVSRLLWPSPAPSALLTPSPLLTQKQPPFSTAHPDTPGPAPPEQDEWSTLWRDLETHNSVGPTHPSSGDAQRPAGKGPTQNVGGAGQPQPQLPIGDPGVPPVTHTQSESEEEKEQGRRRSKEASGSNRGSLSQRLRETLHSIKPHSASVRDPSAYPSASETLVPGCHPKKRHRAEGDRDPLLKFMPVVPKRSETRESLGDWEILLSSATSAGQVGPMSTRVQWPVKGNKTAAIEMTLLRAAEAVERQDLGTFHKICLRLKPFTRRRGVASERTVYCILEALRLRVEGRGRSTLTRRHSFTVKEMSESRVWFATSSPVFSFTSIVSLGMLLPSLFLCPSVHILNFGELLLPSLPRIMALLARPHQHLHGLQGGLRRLRVSHVRGFGLTRVGRTEYETLNAPVYVAAALQRCAEECGVHLTFDSIFLTDKTASLIDSIVSLPDEATVVTSTVEMKFFSEEMMIESGGSVYGRVMECVRRVRPVLVTMVEEDYDSVSQGFIPRFMSALRFLRASHEAGDSSSRSTNPKHLYAFEDPYVNLITHNIIACEGNERRWRPKCLAEVGATLRGMGFEASGVPGAVVHAAEEMLCGKEEEWGVVCEGHSLSLVFNGTKIVSASSWRPCQTHLDRGT